jgi:hypothetical protein
MSQDEYTPSTKEIRRVYVGCKADAYYMGLDSDDKAKYKAEFNRWLTKMRKDASDKGANRR